VRLKQTSPPVSPPFLNLKSEVPFPRPVRFVSAVFARTSLLSVVSLAAGGLSPFPYNRCDFWAPNTELPPKNVRA